VRTLIINDTHLGVSRQAGTTRDSKISLEAWMLQEFKKLFEVPHDNVIILGDLCDSRNVEEHIMAEVIHILKGEDAFIVAGNHDLGGKNDHNISSAQFIAKMSGSRWIDEPTVVNGRYILPHLIDQAAFDKAVQECPDNTIMLCHANIDSPWAHSDHSLNLTLQQIVELEKRGVDVISAHEHAKRDYQGVTILGNQFPSSISDCLGGDKFCHILEGDELTEILTWDCKSNFYQGPDVPTDHYDFIEITGECELSEYPTVVKSVGELRKDSSAFIVKNSVKVREFTAEVSKDEVTKFNIVEMLLEEIPEEYREEIKACL